MSCFFLLGYVVGSNGELTLGRLGKSKSLRVAGDMYLGDPVVNHPAFTYINSEQGLSWYVHKDEPEMFEKIPISSSIEYGYRDGRLTAVYFWIQNPHLNEVQSVVDLLTKRYGKYRKLSYGYGSETYIWETDKVCALLDMWQNHTAEVVICDREFGITYIDPYFR